MTSVTINGDERPLDDAPAGWVTQQIERRRRDGIAVCVVVHVKTTNLDFFLATPECARRAGRGRPLSADVRGIVELWQKHGLNEAGFSPGQVLAFLARLKHLL